MEHICGFFPSSERVLNHHEMVSSTETQTEKTSFQKHQTKTAAHVTDAQRNLSNWEKKQTKQAVWSGWKSEIRGGEPFFFWSFSESHTHSANLL